MTADPFSKSWCSSTRQKSNITQAGCDPCQGPRNKTKLQWTTGVSRTETETHLTLELTLRAHISQFSWKERKLTARLIKKAACARQTTLCDNIVPGALIASSAEAAPSTAQNVPPHVRCKLMGRQFSLSPFGKGRDAIKSCIWEQQGPGKKEPWTSTSN